MAAAPIKAANSLFHLFRHRCACKSLNTASYTWVRLRHQFRTLGIHIPKLFLLSAAGIKSETVETGVKNETGKESESKTFIPNDPRLRSEECLKNAAGLSLDSTSAVLSQAVYAVTKIEGEYVQLVNVLILLMEYQLQVLDHPKEEQRIADIIVETRHEINKVTQRKQDLAILFASAEKLAEATAEVAFAAGAEYASTSAGERLYSAQREVQRVVAESEAVEKKLQAIKVKSIDAVSKHKEEEKRKEEKLKKKKEKEEKEKEEKKNPQEVNMENKNEEGIGEKEKEFGINDDDLSFNKYTTADSDKYDNEDKTQW